MAPVENAAGELTGIWRIRPVMEGKVERRGLGPIKGCFAPVIDHAGLEVLTIAEGVEDALAAWVLTTYPAWAALSSGNMADVRLPVQFKQIIICADHDAGWAEGRTYPRRPTALRGARDARHPAQTRQRRERRAAREGRVMAFRDQFDGFEDIGPDPATAGGQGQRAQPGDSSDEVPSPLGFDLRDWDAQIRFAGEAKPQEWLIGGGIPRKVAGLIAAAGDTGKSFTALELCLRVTRGPIAGFCLEPLIFGGLVQSFGAALLITAEDGHGSVHRRLRALDPDGQMQANRKYPFYAVALPDAGGPFPIVTEERGKIVPTAQFAALREKLRAIPDLALVVLDPLQCFVFADVNADPQAAAITMGLLNMLAAETGATVLVTHHVRKEREAPKSAQEARHLIRGSSALVDQARVAIVLWTPDEAEVRKICRAMHAAYAPNAVVHGAVVKSNDGASRERWTLLRGPTGALRDITSALKARGGDRETHLAALVDMIAAAAWAGRPYTRTGVNGLHQRRAELGEDLATFGRDRLEAMADDLLQSGRIVAALACGTSVKWLDAPEGPFALGSGEFAPGAGTGKAGRKAC